MTRKRRAVPAEPIARRFGLAFAAARRRVLATAQEALAQTPLTHRQLTLLHVLAERGATTTSDLAEAICGDVSIASRMIDRLARDGLVRRTSDPRDRRVTRIELTSAGAKLRAQVLPPVRRALARMLSTFSEEEIATLLALLERLGADLLPGHGSEPSPSPARKARARG